MKITLKRPSSQVIAKALAHLRAAYLNVPMNPDALKHEVALIDLIAFHLDQAPDWISDDGNKAMFHCFRPQNHSNGDANASLWSFNDYHDSGVGRWGCVCGLGSDDVYGFLTQLHGYTTNEALAHVQRWVRNHRSMRIRRARVHRHDRRSIRVRIGVRKHGGVI